jgi:hypothetical protein
MSVERGRDGAKERDYPANRGIFEHSAGEVTSLLPQVRTDSSSARTPPRRGYGRPGAPGSRPLPTVDAQRISPVPPPSRPPARPAGVAR